ncbi:MAG TPA: DivIVA domain-containing protein [Acidimicrobiales bacterium]|nr:DivIVA domain-containing protein [Acidimicrobiales bacterium]
MEISGKALREVEFRDRLRGYDTDEVDEFLEKVAVAVDDMRAQLAELAERAKRTDRQVEDIPGFDDDAIRRTLVLAQRTADLAVSEAREEAARILEDARSQSDALVGQARETARHMRDEAEQEMNDRVARLGDQRERLEREVQSLSTLMETERDRLTQALSSALRYVGDALTVSDAFAAQAATSPAVPQPAPSGYGEAPAVYGEPPEPAAPAENGQALPDVESEISEDAASAYGGAPRDAGSVYPATSMQPAVEQEPGWTGTGPSFGGPPTDAADPDEALWARWAAGRDLDVAPPGPDAGAHPTEQYRLGSDGGSWSA